MSSDDSCWLSLTVFRGRDVMSVGRRGKGRVARNRHRVLAAPVQDSASGLVVQRCFVERAAERATLSAVDRRVVEPEGVQHGRGHGRDVPLVQTVADRESCVLT